MSHIFLVCAEHHLFQVRYAIDHFKLDKKDVVLIIEDTDLNHSIVNKIANSSEFENFIVFESWVFKDLILNRKRVNAFIEICQKVNISYPHIHFFASHYDTDSTLLFLSLVKPSKFYLLDEGSASFSVNDKRNKNVHDSIPYLIKSLLYKVKIGIPKSLIYFTKYDFHQLKNDTIEKYSLKKKNNPLKVLIPSETVFLGSSVSDIGFMNEDVYLGFLKKIHAGHSEKTLYYYPHRKENKTKLLNIQKIGFTIVKLDCPFEDMFEEAERFAGKICSFHCSTVLDNISGLNQNLPQLIIYKFDANYLLQDAQIYETIFKYMKENKDLSIIDL